MLPISLSPCVTRLVDAVINDNGLVVPRCCLNRGDHLPALEHSKPVTNRHHVPVWGWCGGGREQGLHGCKGISAMDIYSKEYTRLEL